MSEAVRRPERWDHPFDPAREEMARLEWLAAADPKDEELQRLAREAVERAEQEVDRLLQLGIWSGLQDKRDHLRKILLHDTRIRRFKKGEIVIREGDYGNSAFVILSGSCQVVLQGGKGLTAAQVGKSSGNKVGIIQSLLQWATSKGNEVRDQISVQRGARSSQDDYVPIFLQDVPRILDENRTVLLREGELFGEISVLGRTPRTASVFAAADDITDATATTTTGGGTELLEIRWQGLRDLLKADQGFKEHVYLLYRRNSLKQHLNATPILRFVGNSEGLRASITQRQFKEFFLGRLGWLPGNETLKVGPGQGLQLAFQLRVLRGAMKDLVLTLDPTKALVIGRGTDATLRIPGDKTLSRSHTQIAYDGDNWILRNTSRYGTIVGVETIRGEHILAEGDELSVGANSIVFEQTPESVKASQAASSKGQAYDAACLAKAPAGRGHMGVQVFLCAPRQTKLPTATERAEIHEQLRQRSPRNIVIFVSPTGAQQVWRWLLPEERDSGSLVPREISFASGKVPQTLLGQLLRPLLMGELAKHTEFQSYGEFAWAQKTLEEHEAGIDWTKRALQEPIISAEGSYPNGIVLIRSGFARLSRKYNNGHRTLSYLGRGEVYGFEEIAHNWRFRDEPVESQRTLRALGYCDVLFIPTAVIEKLVLPSFPSGAMPGRIVTEKESPEPKRLPRAGGVDEALIEFLVERRFVNGSQTMVIDLDRCTRCDDCVRGCASTHQGNPRFIRHGPSDGHYMVANACMHCADPVCMIGCPTGAIHRSVDGQVVVNDSTCIGCSTCANNCPYDNIRMVEVRDKRGNYVLDDRNEPIRRSTKCDLCFDREGGPACVRACPHDALIRLNLNTQAELTGWLT